MSEPARIQALEGLVTQQAQALRERDETLAQRDQRIAVLEAQVLALLARVAHLEELLRQTSQNSSKPPSTDPPGAKPKLPKSPSGKKPGGQPGHKGSHRQLLPNEKITEAHDQKPEQCAHCGAVGLLGDDPFPLRHQVLDLPEIVPSVIEWRLHSLRCPPCQKHTRAKLPLGVPRGNCGPGLMALLGFLSGQMHLSKAQMEEILSLLLNIDFSLGAISHYEQLLSEELGTPVQELFACLQQDPTPKVEPQETLPTKESVSCPPQEPPKEASAPLALGPTCTPATPLTQEPAPAKEPDALAASGQEPPPKPSGPVAANVDETPWYEKNRRVWLWVCVTTAFTVFKIQAGRSAACLVELLALFGGIVVSDRAACYHLYGVWYRQLCWAHLLRDFVAISEREGEAGQVGKALLLEGKLLFEGWDRVRQGAWTRSEYAEFLKPLRQRVRELLARGSGCGHKKTERTCKKLLKVEEAMWTFVRVEGVEPTNNAAERAIRAAVLWRKKSLGTRSERGSRFVERILTVVATCKQQGRNVLQYLKEVCQNSLLGLPAPSLLPAP